MATPVLSYAQLDERSGQLAAWLLRLGHDHDLACRRAGRSVHTGDLEMKLLGLHHNAYRCRDSEQTRQFYEEFLDMPLLNAFEIRETKSGRPTLALHSFYGMEDGSCLAFFETLDLPFEFKDQHDYDLHIALEVPHEDLERWLAKGKQAGIETRGISDHEFIESVYFRDPNGYVIELTAKLPNHAEAMDPERNNARANLNAWQQNKAALSK